MKALLNEKAATSIRAMLDDIKKGKPVSMDKLQDLLVAATAILGDEELAEEVKDIMVEKEKGQDREEQ